MRSRGLQRALEDGFTLMELLVVLTLIGLLMAMVGPNLQQMAGSMDRATRRGGLVADIAGLSHRAYMLGQSFELSSSAMERVLADGNPVLAVPWGWRVESDKPIQFSFNGLCSGGELSLVSPDGAVERLRLAAPDCRVQGV